MPGEIMQDTLNSDAFWENNQQDIYICLCLNLQIGPATTNAEKKPKPSQLKTKIKCIPDLNKYFCLQPGH